MSSHGFSPNSRYSLQAAGKPPTQPSSPPKWFFLLLPCYFPPLPPPHASSTYFLLLFFSHFFPSKAYCMNDISDPTSFLTNVSPMVPTHFIDLAIFYPPILYNSLLHKQLLYRHWSVSGLFTLFSSSMFIYTQICTRCFNHYSFIIHPSNCEKPPLLTFFVS